MYLHGCPFFPFLTIFENFLKEQSGLVFEPDVGLGWEATSSIFTHTPPLSIFACYGKQDRFFSKKFQSNPMSERKEIIQTRSPQVTRIGVCVHQLLVYMSHQRTHVSLSENCRNFFDSHNFHCSYVILGGLH